MAFLSQETAPLGSRWLIETQREDGSWPISEVRIVEWSPSGLCVKLHFPDYGYSLTGTWTDEMPKVIEQLPELVNESATSKTARGLAIQEMCAPTVAITESYGGTE